MLCAPSFLVLLRVCGTFARRRSFLQLAPLLSVQSLYAARELPAEASNVEGLIDVTNNAFETLRTQCMGLTPWLSWQCLPFFISDPGDCCFVQEEIRELPGLNRRRVAHERGQSSSNKRALILCRDGPAASVVESSTAICEQDCRAADSALETSAEADVDLSDKGWCTLGPASHGPFKNGSVSGQL